MQRSSHTLHASTRGVAHATARVPPPTRPSSKGTVLHPPLPPPLPPPQTSSTSTSNRSTGFPQLVHSTGKSRFPPFQSDCWHHPHITSRQLHPHMRSVHIIPKLQRTRRLHVQTVPSSLQPIDSSIAPSAESDGMRDAGSSQHESIHFSTPGL